MTDEEEEGVRILRKELEQWKSVALYLADCHAATAAHAASVKSTPKSSRERLREICERALAMVNREQTAPVCTQASDYAEYVRRSLVNAIADFQPPAQKV
jgi:hypothetical protein